MERLSPREMIRKVEVIASRMCTDRYGRTPVIELHGDFDVPFAYVPVHIEYILHHQINNLPDLDLFHLLD